MMIVVDERYLCGKHYKFMLDLQEWLFWKLVKCNCIFVILPIEMVENKEIYEKGNCALLIV